MNNNTAIKKKLRENLLRKREKLTRIEVAERSKKVFENFQKAFKGESFQGITIAACYSPINNEVDVLSILNLLHQKRIIVALPKMVKKELKFYEWNEGQPLICNRFSIKEPADEKEVSPNLLIIPLLGFDKHGNRLGYGFGYYDKTLSKLPQTKKIGVGYSFQQVENVPLESHDVKLDLIITDNAIIKVNQ